MGVKSLANIGTLTVSLVAQATAFEKTMREAERTMKSTARMFRREARQIERTGKGLMVGLSAPILLASGLFVKAATDWEDAYAGVIDKVEATDAQHRELSKTIRDMAYDDVPVAVESLANLAETAGTLGIQREAVTGFVRTMADLGATTKFAGEEAATTLARLDNIMQSGQKSFDRMGSTIVAVGGSLATSEAEVAAMALRLAGAGKVVGMAEHQVLSFSGALSSVGVEVQAGGTAMSKLMIEMANAAASGGEKLTNIAKVAGMSASGFKQAWQKDAAGAIVTFIEGLGRIRASGGNVFAVIDKLGMGEVRMRDALLRASGAGDLFRRSLKIGAKAWEENNALTEKAARRYKTLGAQFKFARNRIKEVAITLGESLAPYVNTALDSLKPLLDMARRTAEMFANLNPILRTTIVMSVLLVAAVGPAIYVYGRLLGTLAAVYSALVMATAMTGKAAFAFAAWRGGAASLGEVLGFLAGSKVKLVVVAIGAAIAATVLIVRYWSQLSAFASAVWSAVGAAALYGASLVVRGVGLILSVIGVIVPAVRGTAQAVIGLADNIKASASKSLGSAKSAMATAGAAQQAAKGQQDLIDSSQGVADAGQQAAEGQEDLADATEAAAKAAGRNIQSFDEVHQLQDSMASSPAATIPELGTSDIPEISFPGVAGVADIAAGIGEQVSKVADTASAAWSRLKQAMEPVNKAVQWIKDNWPTIGPIIETIAALLTFLMIPALINTGIEATISAAKVVAAWIAQGWEAAASVAKQVAQMAIVVAKWIWMGIKATINGAKVVAAWVAQGWEAVASVAKQVAQMVIAGAKWVWLGIKATISGAKVVAAWIVQKVEAIASVAVQIAQFVILGAKWVWMGVTAMANAAVMAAAWFVALGPVAWVIATVAAVALAVALNWDAVKTKTIEIWSMVSAWLAEKWEWIKGVATDTWNNIKGVIETPIKNVQDWLISTWTNVASRLKSIWSGIKDTAGDMWKGVANTIISMINKVVDALNGMVRGMNKLHWSVPDWVPIMGGKSWGFNLPTIKKIPMLAEGGIVTAPTLAMLGEAGRPEAVIPLSGAGGGLFSAIEEAVERGSYTGTYQGARIASATGSGGEQQELVLRIDSTTLARLILPAIIKEGQRQGLDLVVRPQGV